MSRFSRFTGLFWSPNQPQVKVGGTLLPNDVSRELNPYGENTLVLKDRKCQLSKSELSFIDGKSVVGKYRESFPIVHGSLTNGRIVTLSQCEMNAIREQTVFGEINAISTKYARAVYIGRHYVTNEDATFQSVEIVPDTEVLSQIMSGSFTVHIHEARDNSFSIKYGDLSIDIESSDVHAFSRFYRIRVSSSSSRHAEEYYDIVCIRLLSFLTLFSGRLNYLHSFTGVDSEGTADVIINHRWYREYRRDLRSSSLLLQYDDLGGIFVTMLEKWIIQWDRVGYLYDEFFSMLFRRPIHPRQAERSAYAILEGLHKELDGPNKDLARRFKELAETVIPVAHKKDRVAWQKTNRLGRNAAQHGGKYQGNEEATLRCARLMTIIYMYSLVKIGLPFDKRGEKYSLLFSRAYEFMKSLFLSSHELSRNRSKSTGYVVSTPDGNKRVAYTDELAGLPIQIFHDVELAKRFDELDLAGH